MSKSPHKLIFSLEPDPPIGSLDVALIFEIQVLDESHKELLLNLSVHPLLISISASDSLF